MGSSLAEIEARRAPWWPGDIGNNKSKSSGVWGEVSPVAPGYALRAGKPGNSVAARPNLVFFPGTKEPAASLRYRDAHEILTGARKFTAGLTSYGDLGPQACSQPSFTATLQIVCIVYVYIYIQI